jgi:hypothetical protein
MAYMKFNFAALTHSPDRLNVISTKLGAAKGAAFTDSDVLKPMVLGTAGNMVIAVEGDEIEGWLDNVDAGGTTDGFAFGGVACGTRGMRVEAQLVGTADVKDFVVAAAQEAVGTKAASGLGKVKVGVKAVAGTTLESPANHKWRIIAVKTKNTASAVDGDIVVLELI